MEKKVAIYENFEAAEEAERSYYLSLSPEERLEIAEKLRREYQALTNETEQRLRRVFRIVKQK